MFQPMSIKDIVIYGTGAIGSVLATFLQLSNAEGEKNIHLVGRASVLDSIKENGLTFIPYQETNQQNWITTTGFNYYTNIQQVPRADVIFCTMKAHSLQRSLEDAKDLLSSNPTVFITMNGLGLAEIVEKYLTREHIIECIVLFPSKLENNIVRNTGGNSTIIAEKNEISKRLIPQLFKPDTLDIQLDKNCKQRQWQKAVMNIGMNAISAITMKTVGEVLATEPLRKIISQLIQETILISQKEGINLPEDMEEKFWDFCSKDPNHRPSTQQDIKRGKPTETKFLNGYIVRKGKEYGFATPANSSITSLMDIIEKKI